MSSRPSSSRWRARASMSNGAVEAASSRTAAAVEIDRQRRSRAWPRPRATQRVEHGLVDARREQAVGHGVAGEDVGERRRQHDAEPVVVQRPHGVLARGAAAEVRARQQHRRAGVARIVQHESGAGGPAIGAPVVEERVGEPGAPEPLQELLRDDLIGVDVAARQRRDAGRCACGTAPSRSAELPVADVGEMPADRRRGRHRRAHQVRAAAAALAAFEVAVAGRGAPLARAAARRRSCPGTSSSRARAIRSRPPAGSSCRPFGFGGALDRLRSGHDQRAHRRRHVVAAGDARRLAQVLDPRVRARADEDAVDRNRVDRRARRRAPCRPAPARWLARALRRGRAAGSGTRAGDRRDHVGARAPGDERRHGRGVDVHLAVEAWRRDRTRSSRQRATAAVQASPRGRVRPALEVGEWSCRRRPTRLERAPASMLMLQSVIRSSIDSARDGLAGELDGVAGAAGARRSRRSPPAPGPWRSRPGARRAVERAPASPSAAPDARHCVASTCSTSEVPMPKASAPNAPCVVVWLSPQTMVMPGCVRPSSGPMTCTMPWVGESRSCSVMPWAAQLAASASSCATASASVIGRWRGPVDTLWSSVATVRSGRRTGRPAEPQPLERLRRRDLVDEVQVDVEQVAPAVERLDDVRVPQLVEQRARSRDQRPDAMVRPVPFERVDHRALDRRADLGRWWPACRRAAPGRPAAARAPALRAWRRRRRRLRAACCAVCRSSSAMQPMAPIGLAMSWPAMSGAEPCTGSYSATVPPSVADGSSPSDPADHGRLVAQDVAEQVVGQHRRRTRWASWPGAWRSVHVHVRSATSG